MKPFVWALVIAGVAACAGAALAAGLDPTGVVIFAGIVAVGGAAIASTRKTDRIQPAGCAECGGLISPNAPYCKHCGARREPGATAARPGS